MKVDSSGVALDVQVEGEGRPVVLVHGWPDTKRLWTRQVPALVDAGYQVISYDQRGYGASDKPEGIDAYSIPFLAIDVTAVLDHLGIEKAHLVGHDWGAAVVWATAAFAPERVDHLVAMSVGHPSAFANMGMEQRQKSWYMLLFQFHPQAEQWLTMNDGANFREFSQHPDFDAVYAELQANGSLTPGLNYYRANVTPDALGGPAARAARDPGSDHGHVELRRLRAHRGADDGFGQVLLGPVPLRTRGGSRPLDAVGGPREGQRAAVGFPTCLSTRFAADVGFKSADQNPDPYFEMSMTICRPLSGW